MKADPEQANKNIQARKMRTLQVWGHTTLFVQACSQACRNLTTRWQEITKVFRKGRVDSKNRLLHKSLSTIKDLLLSTPQLDGKARNLGNLVVFIAGQNIETDHLFAFFITGKAGRTLLSPSCAASLWSYCRITGVDEPHNSICSIWIQYHHKFPWCTNSALAAGAKSLRTRGQENMGSVVHLNTQ